MKKKTFTVGVHYTEYASVQIEASSKEEAMKKVEKLLEEEGLTEEAFGYFDVNNREYGAECFYEN